MASDIQEYTTVNDIVFLYALDYEKRVGLSASEYLTTSSYSNKHLKGIYQDYAY